MKRKLVFFALGLSFSLLVGLSPAFCADVVGTVMDLQGRPASGVKIVVRDTAGKIFGQATTDAKGHYAIAGLSPNTYDYTLNPLATGFKGGSAVSHLDSEGLTINWKVSNAGDATALATQGSKEALAGDPFGLSMGEFASVVVLGTAGVAAGVVGGYGAAGGFSGGSSHHHHHHPTSSSM
jgi:hypothetical protein